MTFNAYETANGSPVEFVTFNNGGTIWRVTNAVRDVSPLAAVFSPLAYKRTAPSNSKSSDDARIRMTLPGNFPVVKLYTNIMTSNITTVTIERFHNDDPDAQVQVYWKGAIASVIRKDTQAEILMKPITQGGHEIPRYTYQSACNYFLYDGSSCRIARGDFKFDATVTGIVNGTELEVSGLRAEAAILDTAVNGLLSSTELDNYWLNGYVETAAGELRSIRETFVGGDPDVIRVAFQFLNLEAGDGLTVYAGCARTANICDRKFDNIINFGGFNNVPPINVMAGELPAGNSSSSKKAFWGN